MRAQASNLEQEDTVILEKVVHLSQEGLVAPDTNVLCPAVSTSAYSTWRTSYLSHLERDDLRVRALAARHVAVVRAQDLMARRVAALPIAVMRGG